MIKNLLPTLAFISACAIGTDVTRGPDVTRLEFKVDTGKPDQTLRINGETLVGSEYVFGNYCKGQDILLQRGKDPYAYVELVRVRDCVEEPGGEKNQRPDYRDFTPTNKLELGPNRIEIILPANVCVVKTIKYENSERVESPWTKVECVTLEKIAK